MKGKLYVHILLDRSGSMMAGRGPTLTAYNAYIDGLEPDAVVSLTTFSSLGILHPRTNVAPARAKFTADEYMCAGGTPLRDAIGQTLQSIETAAKEFERIVMVIQTDGHDTDSREFTAAQIRQLLTDKQEGEGWLVIFLGAGLDAFSQAQTLGMMAENAMNYSVGNSAQAMGSVLRASQAYASAPTRSAGRLESAFTDAERDRSK